MHLNTTHVLDAIKSVHITLFYRECDTGFQQAVTFLWGLRMPGGRSFRYYCIDYHSHIEMGQFLQGLNNKEGSPRPQVLLVRYRLYINIGYLLDMNIEFTIMSSAPRFTTGSSVSGVLNGLKSL